MLGCVVEWPSGAHGPYRSSAGFPSPRFQGQGAKGLLGRAWFACATGRDLLGAHEDRGWGEVQAGGQLVDVGEGQVALAALDPSVVAAIEAADEREPFLRYAAFFAQFAQCFPERSVDRGDRGHAGESVRRTAIMPLVIRSITRWAKGCRAAAVQRRSLSMHDEKMVDPLAMALFGVVRDLPADERRALLSVIDSHLRGMCGESAHLAEQVVRQDGESQRRTTSKCRDKPRPKRRPKRAVPSSSTTHVANSGGSRVRAMGTSPSGAASVGAQTRGGFPRQRPVPSDDEILEELRRCAREMDVEFGYDEYRMWALAQQVTNPDRPALLIDVRDLIGRFGSYPRARIAAGLEQVPRRLVEEDDEGSFVACVSAVQAAACEIGRTRVLSAREYMQWRSAHLRDKRRRRALAPPPEWKIISDRFGTWPRALSAAGLISPREAADYCGEEATEYLTRISPGGCA